MSANILFYSKECLMCQNLLKVLQNEKFLTFFTLYCVDDNLDKVPPAIKKVPTMIIADIPKPLVEKETFEWVQQVKFLRQNIVPKSNIIPQNTPPPESNKEPMGWIEQEMCGKSDEYAYKDVDKAMLHSYYGVSDNPSECIFTPKESQKKIDLKSQYQMLNSLSTSRSEQDVYLSQLQKEQQLEILLKKSNNINNQSRS